MSAELHALSNLWKTTAEPNGQTRAAARARLFEEINVDARTSDRVPASARRRHVAVAIAVSVAVALVVLTSALAVDRDLWRSLVGTHVDKAEIARENRAAFTRIDASGRHVDLRRGQATAEAAAMNKMLRNFGDVRLIAHREGRSFYVFEPKTPDGQRCFAIGRDGQPQPGGILCPGRGEADGFPSPRYPILDMSTIGADRQDPAMRVITLQGFAADAITNVGIRIGSKIEAETPVVDNVYVRTSGLPEEGGEIVGLDEQGHVIGCASPQATPTSGCSALRP